MAGGKMPDVRGLVPRTPPEGLREWALTTCGGALGRYGLVYEVEWARDFGWTDMLDEYAVPKKQKMVRVTCSCCGESMLLDWAKSETKGYGFVHPDDQEGDWGWTVTEAGAETTCPICAAPVLVNKRSEVRDWYLTGETSVMSADVLGEERYLALTCWTVQRRVYKSGSGSLVLLPAEAYVFSADGCAKLSGWRNSYSGNAGYFISFKTWWSQPKDWSESFGAIGDIFGLTPELIECSCLPHCKLDVYMGERVGASHYPVAYLRLYQTHPNVEAVLLHGLPRVLDDLIRAEVTAPDWHKNKQGALKLYKLDWTQTRPAQILRLTKEQLRMAQVQCWGFASWELFVLTKGLCGELLTERDMQDAFCLGDEHLSLLVLRGQVAKSIRYLLHQCQVLALEVGEAGADPISDAQILRDYWDMSELLGRNLNDPAVRYPDDLIAAHDRVAELVKLKKADGYAELFRVRRRVLRKYSFKADGLLIRPADSQRELTAEGDHLHHCVATYGASHATGKTAIFFVRRASRPREPFYTLELDEKTLTVRQNRGMRNCAKTPEIQAFEDKWLAWVREGAPRGKDGKPVMLAGRSTRRAA